MQYGAQLDQRVAAANDLSGTVDGNLRGINAPRSIRHRPGAVGRAPRAWRTVRVLAIGLAITSAMALCLTAEPFVALGVSSGAAATTNWTVYHGDALGSGNAASLRSVATSKRAWTSSVLDGNLYTEPLIFGGDVYVASANDTVFALSTLNGRIVWFRHVASAVPASALSCGNITPDVGIIGTPVIDPQRHELFVVADELVRGRPQHRLIGLNALTGAVELNERVDPPGADPSALLQRTGLNLDHGNVVFAFGGNYGDCGTYRGRVVAVAERGGTPGFFSVDATAGESQGAIWMGGAAPVVDRQGNIWVSVGNGSANSATQGYDNSDSILELSSSLRLEQFFAPTSWPQNNASDLDMSMAPALLSNGQVVLSGKSRTVYLLDGGRLGGIGGEQASLANACSDDIDGGSAVVGRVVYLPCLSGPVAIRVGSSPASITLLWSANAASGPPIAAAGLVWTIGQDGVLYGLDPASGVAHRRVNLGKQANHFPTPSVGAGLLVATTANRVVAFHTSSRG